VSVCSFSGIAEDFTSAGRQADLQVPSHSLARSLVLSVLFPFASWFFGCRLCGVSSRWDVDFGDLLVFGIIACFLVFSQTV
jgi:hypothetical protein